MNYRVSLSLLIPSAFLLSESERDSDGARESERDSDGERERAREIVMEREREREMEGVVGEEREIRKRRVAVILNGQHCTGKTRLELTAW